MKEEKAITKYEEPKGLIQWLKSKFEKIKQKFKIMPKGQNDNVEKGYEEIKSSDEHELSEEELDKVKAGFSLKEVDMEELMADLGMKDLKSWDLTKEQKNDVEKGYEEIKALDEDELSEDELDKVIAGQPLIEDDEYTK